MARSETTSLKGLFAAIANSRNYLVAPYGMFENGFFFQASIFAISTLVKHQS